MFRNHRQIVDNFLNGKGLVSTFRKYSTFGGNAGVWCDMSMTAGTPPGNFYASTPLIAKRLSPWKGIYAGPEQAPSVKHLLGLTLIHSGTALRGVFKLLDYLLYYPFIDFDDTSGPQDLDNTSVEAEQLDRYTDGIDNQVILVAQAPVTGNGTFRFNYINEHDVEQTSPLQYCSAAVAYGQLATCAQYSTMTGPFLSLTETDKGIKRITSVTNVIANGGLGALVIVRPLFTLIASEGDVVNESMYGINTSLLPKIADNAFLGFIFDSYGTKSAAVFSGRLDIAWT